jgi:hypothetical protein
MGGKQRAPWPTPVIPAAREAETGRVEVQAEPGPNPEVAKAGALSSNPSREAEVQTPCWPPSLLLLPGGADAGRTCGVLEHPGAVHLLLQRTPAAPEGVGNGRPAVAALPELHPGLQGTGVEDRGLLWGVRRKRKKIKGTVSRGQGVSSFAEPRGAVHRDHTSH